MTPIRLGIQGSVPHGQNYIYVLLALLNGAVLPIQSNLNAQLGRSLNSVPLAADISYFIGSIALMSLLCTGWFGAIKYPITTPKILGIATLVIAIVINQSDRNYSPKNVN